MKETPVCIDQGQEDTYTACRRGELRRGDGSDNITPHRGTGGRGVKTPSLIESRHPPLPPTVFFKFGLCACLHLTKHLSIPPQFQIPKNNHGGWCQV